MPERVVVTYPKSEQPKTYYRYSINEFIKTWEKGPNNYSHFYDCEIATILFFTSHFMTAVIIAALFMRELDFPLTCTYYSEKKRVLYLYYGSYTGPHTQEKTEEYKRATISLINKATDKIDVASIKYDKWGEILLKF
jgi:hypothetical protein